MVRSLSTASMRSDGVAFRAIRPCSHGTQCVVHAGSGSEMTVPHRLSAVFEALLRGWNGEEAVVRFDAPTDTWMMIGVHSTVLGPAMGGTRMKVYAAPEDALADVLWLSEAMTFKQAAADLPYGGGKAVLAVPALPARGSA